MHGDPERSGADRRRAALQLLNFTLREAVGVDPEMDGGAAAVAQFEMSSDEVSVEVTQEDVANVEAQLFRVVQIRLNVALRIDDDRKTGYWKWRI